MNLHEYESLFKGDSNQKNLFNHLKDQQFHCRSCLQRDYPEIAQIRQIAGGGGIQGLERGNKTRPGIKIETKQQFCKKCNKVSSFDRWTGEFQTSNAPSTIPEELVTKILNYYNYTDSIEGRKRPKHELVIDHRFPMERWGDMEDINKVNMSNEDIERKFQLLKKDCSGNHNLLKSRSCEDCIKTNRRGKPLDIPFWYEGEDKWDPNIPTKGPEAEQGCIGCGWYDYKKWKDSLITFLKEEWYKDK